MNIHRLVNSLGSELMEEKSTSNPTKNQGIRPILMKRTIVPDGSQIYKKVGDTLKLECQVDGMPPPTIVWYKVRRKSMSCLLSSIFFDQIMKYMSFQFHCWNEFPCNLKILLLLLILTWSSMSLNISLFGKYIENSLKVIKIN